MAQINAEVITDTTVANSKCESLLLEPFVGLDCECVNLGPGGELSLIQVIGSDRKVLLFDVLTCPAIMSGKLRTLLEDQNTLKVIHDCRGDRANLKAQFGINLDPVFDTQIAYKVIHFRDSVHRISWNKMCVKYQLTPNPLKQKFHGIFDVNKSFWKTRPLTQDMIQYAAGDVIHLHGLHPRLSSKIKSSQRECFEQQCMEATKEDNTDASK